MTFPAPPRNCPAARSWRGRGGRAFGAPRARAGARTDGWGPLRGNTEHRAEANKGFEEALEQRTKELVAPATPMYRDNTQHRADANTAFKLFCTSSFVSKGAGETWQGGGKRRRLRRRRRRRLRLRLMGLSDEGCDPVVGVQWIEARLRDGQVSSTSTGNLPGEK